MEPYKLLSQSDSEIVTKRICPIPFAYEADYYYNLINTTSFPEIVLAIPYGKKFCVYFSYYKDKDVCYLIELNRDKTPVRISIVNIPYKKELSIGTLLYGTLIPLNTIQTPSTIFENDLRSIFVIEDIYLWNGVSTEDMMYSQRLGYIKTLFETYGLSTEFNTTSQLLFYLPMMWFIHTNTCERNQLEKQILLSYYSKKDSIIYQVHHLQMRNIQVQSPYLNIQIGVSATNTITKELISNIHVCPYTHDYFKPIYKVPSIFIVKPSPKYDLYYLYCMDSKNDPVFYGFAGIPDLKTSVFMNLLFRNLKENMNLDHIQESDDEEDEHVELKDMNRSIHMNCEFHMKIKKWVPIQTVSSMDSKNVVKLDDLINTSTPQLQHKPAAYNTIKPVSKKMK